MHRSYNDILSRIPEPPLWWQEGGIPRYDVFDPRWSTSVYASEVVLAEIACQHTGLRFFVTLEGGAKRLIANAIRDHSLRYGDPPNIPGVSAFSTSDMLRVVEYWSRSHQEYVVDRRIVDQEYFEWQRDPSLEVTFPNDWGV